MHTARLAKGREKSLLRRHPWIFSNAVERLEGSPAPGDTVRVVDARGNVLGLGAWSPASQIRIRMWTFGAEEPEIEAAFFAGRIADAIARRTGEFADPAGGARLIYAENDGLPGLIVDRYAGHLVCQFLAAGVERWKREIVAALAERFPQSSIYERSDADVRAKEGLAERTGVLHGDVPPPIVWIREGNYRIPVDIGRGHKTGAYLDQRDNRQRLGAMVQGAEVLNCFSYTGGFGLAALSGGAASVRNVDASADALALSAQAVVENGLEAGRVEHVQGDVFALLRQYRDARRAFDVIVLDPPKFAESKAQVAGAARGYKDINLLACKLLRPGGLLFTFSCSGHMDADLFQKIVADAALDAGRDAAIVARLWQAADHPVRLAFPEGGYLKGLVCRV